MTDCTPFFKPTGWLLAAALCAAGLGTALPLEAKEKPSLSVKSSASLGFDAEFRWSEDGETSGRDTAPEGRTPEFELYGKSASDIAWKGFPSVALNPRFSWFLSGAAVDMEDSDGTPYFALSSVDMGFVLACAAVFKPLQSLKIAAGPRGSFTAAGFSGSDGDLLPPGTEADSFWFRPAAGAGALLEALWSPLQSLKISLESQGEFFRELDDAPAAHPSSGYRGSVEPEFQWTALDGDIQRLRLKLNGKSSYDSGIVETEVRHRYQGGVQWSLKDAFTLGGFPVVWRYKEEGGARSSGFSSELRYTAEGKDAEWYAALEVPWTGAGSWRAKAGFLADLR